MPLFSLLLSTVTLLGHLALWVWLYNRLHAFGLPCKVVRLLEKLLIAGVGISGILLTGALFSFRPFDVSASAPVARVIQVYAVLCAVMLGRVTARWAIQRWTPRGPSPLLSNHTQRLDVTRQLGYRPIGRRATRLAASIPGNQILDVHFQHKVIHHPSLPPELDGLRIAQLSDLHLTGQLTIDFFRSVVEQMNQWQPDFVAVTGDVVDEPSCIDWIPETLGRLRSRHGCFFILGNHDMRLPDVRQLRRAMQQSGLEDLGGRWIEQAVDGQPVLLAGNECPWFPPAPEIPPPSDGSPQTRPFSILLTHSPDQLPWARRNRFDFMLAGHVHGGQIRIPLIGPIVCPSRFGVRYASGLFFEHPTLMHVSRGLSGVHPLRFFCPPEVTLLELRRAGLVGRHSQTAHFA